VPREQLPTGPPTPPEPPEGWAAAPPDFVGVGAQRCGTSWWFRTAIRTHPGVEVSPAGKELHYFDAYWNREPPADLAADYARFFPRPPGAISGEWTPRYMCDLSAMRLLREAAPDARILVMLRDPVERYLSAVARHHDLQSEAGEPEYLPFLNDAVWRGMYHRHLSTVFEHFPRERVLVLQLEACVRDPVDEMQRTCAFLGLPPREKPSPRLLDRGREQRRKPALPTAVRNDLIGRYAEDVERLIALVPELDLGLWPNFANRVGEGAATPAAR
jgi:Sulfotransferase domain